MKIHPVVAIHSQIKPVIDRFYPADEPQSGAFDPSATRVAGGTKDEPFQFGTETLLRSQSSPLVFDRADESIGSQTRVLPPEMIEPAESSPAASAPAPAPAPAESQLDRIEHHLAELIRHLESLQRRIDAMDATLARILTRH
jgi:hypothetical protein